MPPAMTHDALSEGQFVTGESWFRAPICKKRDFWVSFSMLWDGRWPDLQPQSVSIWRVVNEPQKSTFLQSWLLNLPHLIQHWRAMSDLLSQTDLILQIWEEKTKPWESGWQRSFFPLLSLYIYPHVSTLNISQCDKPPIHLSFLQQKTRIIAPPWPSPVAYYLSLRPDVYGSVVTFMAHSSSLWECGQTHLALISLLPGAYCLTTRLWSLV